jgi:hypothetical protein
MPTQDTIRMLERGAEATDAAEWRRQQARVAWVRETAAKWHDAMRERDDRCTAAVKHLDETDFQRLFDAEQAKVDAVYGPIRAVIEEDRWPRHLYWSL